MKVVERARLGFQEGSSDKVYEVDLVEVAAGQHVVNFRYGRRGSALRDGTKTPLPLPLDKARAIFSALVAEKTKGGYRPLSAEVPAPSKEERDSELLYNEPKWIRMDEGGLRTLQDAGLKLKQGVYY